MTSKQDQRSLHSSSTKYGRVTTGPTDLRRKSASHVLSNTSANAAITSARHENKSHQVKSNSEALTQNGSRRHNSATAAAGLNDLNPHDKAKIARLVEQVMKLSHENEELKREVVEAESAREQVQEDSQICKRDNQYLLEKRQDCLYLLRMYQEKVKFFSDELEFTRRAYDDLSLRFNAAQGDIDELELLVDRQKQTIANDTSKHQSFQTLSNELQGCKDELRHRSEDCVRYKAKCESSESTSKYLATQLDGLLSQLSEKTSRILLLEDRIRNGGAGDVPNVGQVADDGGHPQKARKKEENVAPFSSSFSSSECRYRQESSSLTADTASPPEKPRKVHTPEQLLASWSEQNHEEMTNNSQEAHVSDGQRLATGEALDFRVVVEEGGGTDHALMTQLIRPGGSRSSSGGGVTSVAGTPPRHPSASMIEASAVHLAAPPPPVTPPRKMDLSHSFAFNDSSVEETTLNNGSSVRSSDNLLTDEYFLDAGKRHKGVFPTTTAAVRTSGVRTSSSQTYEQHDSDDPYEPVEMLPPRRAKRTTVAVTRSKSSSAATQSSSLTLKSRHKSVVPRRKVVIPQDNHNTKYSNTPGGEKGVKTESKLSSHKKGAGSGVGTESGPTKRRLQAAQSRQPESPGLKAWEEGARNNFEGYGAQLFDLLDQIDDERVHGVFNSDDFSGNNSRFSDLMTNSDSWM